MQMKPMSVDIADMQWFYRNKNNFVAFSKLLQEKPNSLYCSEFITCLLEENWEELQKDIILKHLVPYLLYAVSSIFYMKYTLAADQ